MAHKLPRIISFIVSASGVLVMIGWIADMTVLKSILPQFVSMKFTTAICFVASGAILYLTERVVLYKREIDSLILTFMVFVIILIMATFMISIFFGIKTGLENLFVGEPAGTVDTVVPGRPALSTMINFILIAIFGLLALFKKVNFWGVCVLGAVISLIGGLSVAGYIIGVPALYYQFNYVSTAMAVHTGFLFTLLGLGCILVARSARSAEAKEV